MRKIKYLLAPLAALVLAFTMAVPANAGSDSTPPDPSSNYGAVIWNNDAQTFGVQTYWPSAKDYDYTIARGQKSSRASSIFLGPKIGGWCVYYRYNSIFGGNPANQSLYYRYTAPNNQKSVLGPFKWDASGDLSRNVEVHVRPRNNGTC